MGVNPVLVSKYMVDTHGLYTNGGKSTDMTRISSTRIIMVINYVSDRQEYVGYRDIKQLKVGILFGSMHNSKTKCFKPKHMIVFANFAHVSIKLSENMLHN